MQASGSSPVVICKTSQLLARVCGLRQVSSIKNSFNTLHVWTSLGEWFRKLTHMNTVDCSNVIKWKQNVGG